MKENIAIDEESSFVFKAVLEEIIHLTLPTETEYIVFRSYIKERCTYQVNKYIFPLVMLHTNKKIDATKKANTINDINRISEIFINYLLKEWIYIKERIDMNEKFK